MLFDSRKYRREMGFTNKSSLKKYFKAKDIIVVNWDKIELCNQRIKDIFDSLNKVVHKSIQIDDMDVFKSKIDEAYVLLKNENIIPRLNNNGRAPEDVYYNWMRGYAVCEFFSKALSIVFGVPQESIRSVGKDQLSDIKTFSKSPTADLEISVNGKKIRLEIQSGFTGVNDIKEHKVREAKNIFKNNDMCSYIVHFDLFNGSAAIVDISNINDDNIHWEKRAEFESQIVFSIPQDAFKWHLPNLPSFYEKIVYIS